MENMDVLDRNALILYLQNVRDLEVALYSIENRFDEEKARFYSKLNSINPIATLYNHIEKPNDSEKTENILFLICNGIVLIGGIVLILVGSTFRCRFWGWLVFLLGICSFPLCLDSCVSKLKSYNQALAEWKTYERNLYENNKKEKERANKDLRRKQQLEMEWEKISTRYVEQYSSAQSLLNSFYSMNIIPVQYRNLPAICYIYDYLSTSRETLTAALFSQQIDNGIKRIEAKLDNIVSVLEEQIYETRCLRDEAHRNNQRQIEQNTKMLETLRQTEQNTQRAAQYAELGANYSKANAFFGMATYLKENK